MSNIYYYINGSTPNTGTGNTTNSNPIPGTQCIGDSLVTINNDLLILDNAVAGIQQNIPLTYFDTDDINLTFSTSTQALSANLLPTAIHNKTFITNPSNSSELLLWDYNGGFPSLFKIALSALTPNTNFSFKNKIINGDMRIDQRYAGVQQTWTRASTNYIVDRFRFGGSGNTTDGTWKSQQVQDGPSGFAYSAKVTVQTAATVTTGDVGKSFVQIVEGLNMYDLAWGTTNAKTCTLSFWVKSSVAGNYPILISNNKGDAGSGIGYLTTYTINTINTWEYKTIIIPGPTSGNWTDTSLGGLRIDYFLGNRTDIINNNTNTWFSIIPGGSSTNVPGSVNLWSNTGATWQTTGVQFETGSVATPFEYRPIQTELALCQRYFQYYADNISIQGYTNVGTASEYTILLPVVMRISPAVSYTIGTHAYSSIYDLVTGSSKDRLFVYANSTINPGVFAVVFNNTMLNAEL